MPFSIFLTLSLPKDAGRQCSGSLVCLRRLCCFAPMLPGARLVPTLGVMLLLAACAARLPPSAGPDAAQCLARLDRAGVRYERAEIAAAPAACAVDAPV